MSTTEGNKIIAEFMGEFRVSSDMYATGSSHNVWYEGDLKYHTSWDWLMPVIEKISRIEFDRHEQELPMGGTEIVVHTHYPRTFGMINKDGNPMFRFNCGQVFEAKTLIEAAWMAVVDFIQSYN